MNDMMSEEPKARKVKNIRIRSKKRESVDKYEWPYYDTYAPGLDMKKNDSKVIKKSL